MTTKLILASTSPYRKELLSRLGLPFDAVAPKYGEENHPGLTSAALASLHARGKALSLAPLYPGRIIIGSDQSAEVDGEILGKPGTTENAILQLARMSGKTVTFHTGVAVAASGKVFEAVVPFRATLRNLSPREIGVYVEREMVLDCAGSFKIEGLGIALMEKLSGDDFTALIGLPLIALTRLLRDAGVDVLGEAGMVSHCGF